AHLRDLETRFQISIVVNADATLSGQQPYLIERGEQVHSVEAAKALAAQQPPVSVEPEPEAEAEEEEFGEEAPAEAATQPEGAEAGERRRRRRRRRRGGGADREREFATAPHA